MKISRIPILIFFLITFFLYFNIGKASINNDAQFWYSRTNNFISAVIRRDWYETFQNPKPGVTVMWVSGLSLRIFLNLYEGVFHFRPNLFTYETFPYVHFSVIAPLVTIVLVSFVVFYYVLKKLFDSDVALFSSILLFFQPIVIGLSRNFHSDAVTMAFMLMSSFFAVYYFTYARKYKWLVISGITAGLALLSKSSAVFLIPYVGFVCLVDFLYVKTRPLDYIFSYIIWFTLLSFVFYALFPAMWVSFVPVLNWIFVEEGLTLVTTGRDGINPFWYYIEPLFRILTPWFLIFLGVGIVSVFIFLKKESRVVQKRILMFLGFIFFYFIQMSLVKQKMDRYLLPILPFMGIIGGYGVSKLYKLVLKYRKHFVLLFLILNLSHVLYYFPNYLLYPSMFGKDQFGCSMCSNIGEYLNSQPNPSDLKIISLSNKLHRLQPFVKGKVYSTNEVLPNNWTPEFVVTSMQEQLPIQYSRCVLDTLIGFRGVDYWKIYSCK